MNSWSCRASGSALVWLFALVAVGATAMFPARASARPLDSAARVQPSGATPARVTPADTLEARQKALAQAQRDQLHFPTSAHERELANQYARLGVLDAAFDHFQAAIRLDRHDALAYEAIARIWRDWGLAGAGLPSAYRAVYWAPESPSAQNTLGTLLLELGQFDAARVRFETARHLAPTAAYPVNNLCYLALRQQRHDEAIRLCRDAAVADRSSTTVRNNLALAQLTAGDVEGALETFRTGPSPAAAAYNEGIVLLATRQHTRAHDAFVRARIADPTFVPALRRLQQLAAASKGR